MSDTKSETKRGRENYNKSGKLERKKERKRQEAKSRNKAWALKPIEEKLLILAGARGDSKKQKTRLEKALVESSKTR
jgi:hypothetical protein